MSLITEHELSQDLRELEQELQGLIPSSMSPGLCDRLEQSMNASVEDIQPSSGDLDDLEIHLEQLAPASMPDDILGRMVRAMDRWHEHVPVEEKVVPFGEGGENEKTQLPSRKQSGGGMLAAVATVALLGAVTALVMPHVSNQPGSSDPGSSMSPVVGSPVSEPIDSNVGAISHVAPREAWLVPDALSHKVTNTSDNGVVMTRDNTPHRCIRVDYVDRIKMQDDQGREIEIERPGVDFMLLPVETN